MVAPDAADDMDEFGPGLGAAPSELAAPPPAPAAPPAPVPAPAPAAPAPPSADQKQRAQLLAQVAPVKPPQDTTFAASSVCVLEEEEDWC